MDSSSKHLSIGLFLSLAIVVLASASARVYQDNRAQLAAQTSDMTLADSSTFGQ